LAEFPSLACPAAGFVGSFPNPGLRCSIQLTNSSKRGKKFGSGRGFGATADGFGAAIDGDEADGTGGASSVTEADGAADDTGGAT
jgi:hypothetical protein